MPKAAWQGVTFHSHVGHPNLVIICEPNRKPNREHLKEATNAGFSAGDSKTEKWEIFYEESFVATVKGVKKCGR